MLRFRRELIAVRLVEIARELVGIASDRVFRNQVDVSARSGNAIVIWDGDDAVIVAASGQRPAQPQPQMIASTPVVRILAEAGAAEVGTVLNLLAAALMKAVLQDAQMGKIVGRNGSMHFDGISQSLERGQKIEGELWVQFAFHYPLIISEL